MLISEYDFCECVDPKGKAGVTSTVFFYPHYNT